MKLLFCPYCHDLFRLQRLVRSCECGRVSGRYINRTEAVVNGEGFSVAISNGSLEDQCYRAQEDQTTGRAEAQIKYAILCWARPNQGPANPHTRVVDEEDGHV